MRLIDLLSKKPSWHCQIIAPGYKYNLTDIAASIGIHQLRKLKDMHEKRIELAKDMTNIWTQTF